MKKLFFLVLMVLVFFGCKTTPTGPDLTPRDTQAHLVYSRYVVGGTYPGGAERVYLSCNGQISSPPKVSEDTYGVDLYIRTETKYRGYVVDFKMFNGNHELGAEKIALNIWINDVKMVCIPVGDFPDPWTGEFSFMIKNDGEVVVYSM